MALGMEKLDQLDSAFADKVRKVVQDMELKGWRIRIIWGKRTQEENMELVKKGYASKTSKHLQGLAVDLIDRSTGYTIEKDHKYYKDLEQIAKRYGLIWGGDFTGRWDPCHIEMP